MRKLFNNNKAETILEAIVAVSVMIIILGPATGIFVSSTRNTGYDRNKLTASILAEEGLELVENIRDTNLLRFSPKAGDCWDTKPNFPNLLNCEQDINKIANGTYAISWNTVKLKVQIALNPNPLTTDLENENNAPYRVSLGGAASGFYREIAIEKKEYLNPPAGADAMKVTSTVFYRGGNKIEAVKRAVILTRQPT